MLNKIIRFFPLPAAFCLIVAASGCLDLSDSVNSLIKSTANSARRQKAILFVKQGGATEADSYQVSIVGYQDEFDTLAVGNTFIVDDHGKAWINPKCVELKWPADGTLLITYDKKLRVFLKNQKVKGIVVVYKQK